MNTQNGNNSPRLTSNPNRNSLTDQINGMSHPNLRRELHYKVRATPQPEEQQQVEPSDAQLAWQMSKKIVNLGFSGFLEICGKVKDTALETVGV